MMGPLRRAGLLIASVLALACAPVSAHAVELAVDRTDDITTAAGGAGCTGAPNDCTLRGALSRADSTVEADLVSLPAGVFRRDPALDGLRIFRSVTIAGAGARATIVEGPNTNGMGATVSLFTQGGQVLPNATQIRDLTITKGIANAGGGIRASNTHLSLVRVTVTGNVAPGIDFMFKTPGLGAGISFNGSGGRTLSIENSTISGNRAEGRSGQSASGGGVLVFGGSATIQSSTIAGNVVDGDGGAALGGGLAAHSGGSIALDRVTVAGNRVEDTGAGQAVANLWREGDSSITAARSIIADGSAPTGSNAENCAVPITSRGSNVEDRDQCGLGAGDRQNATVGLGPVANNGGTTDTRTISTRSAAFDFGGDCVLRDQRGAPRAFAACDSGAFELQVAEGGQPGGADTTKPVLRALALSRTRFRAARPGASAASPVGTTVSYTLSEAAAVTFRVERAAVGRRTRVRCVKPTRSNRRAKKCTRYTLVQGSLTHRSHRGRNKVRFLGRLGGRSLKPGRYRLRGVATDPSGNASRAQRRAFRIARR